MKTIKLWKDPYDIEIDLWKKTSITIKEGLTVLVGCNGIGKSTLLSNIKSELSKQGIEVMQYDNLHDGGTRARDKAGFYGNVELLSTLICSSEGENIAINMVEQARLMGAYIKQFSEQEEYWFLLDAIDSGLSIDNIVDIKKYLFNTIIEHNKHKKVYIIVSANEYEMCNDENCFDVYSGKYVTFSDYGAYREFILITKEWKEQRDNKNKKEVN